MTTITLNKKAIENLLGKKLSQEELKERINYLGISIESINKNNLTVEINPNRPDLLSEQGFARALSSFISSKPGLRNYNVTDSKQEVIIDRSLKAIRPYTVCAIAKDIKLDANKIKELINIQEKLHATFCRNRRKAAIGIYPLNKIKFPIRFTALSHRRIRFKPLGSDKTLTAKEILEHHPAGKEYGHLLAGLKEYPVFIDADNNILSMPPIINSELTGKVTKRTKDLFIECSGHDIHTLSKCLNIIVTALADMNANICSLHLKYPNQAIITPNLKPRKMAFNKEYADKILGLKLDHNRIKQLLSKMGIGYAGNEALIPAYRADIIHPIDLVEELAIAYGYNNIREELPRVATIAEENPVESFRNRLANILANFSLIETNTYHLINKEESQNKAMIKGSYIELENSLSQEYNALRLSLAPSLLNVLRSNMHASYPQNIFEIAKTFRKNDDNAIETYNLCIALCNKEADFTSIKQILDALSIELGSTFSISESDYPIFIPGRSAIIKARGKRLGIIGEINPLVLYNYGLEVPVSLLELDIELLLSLLKSK